MRSFVCALLCVMFHFIPSFAQNSKPLMGKQPAWLTTNKIDYTATLLDREAEDGSVDVDYEKQVNLSDQSVYIRQSTKILSEAGVQDNSQVTVNFDPSYQQLIFHTIQIIRNGVFINQLDLQKIKTIQQETDLDKFIYNGQLQSILVLDDVRKGDIIEYSYTLKGFNPVFQNKFQTVLDTKFSVPIYNVYYKIIVPIPRNINIKNNNDGSKPLVHNENNNTIYEWRQANSHALHVQSELPDWYEPYSSVMVSEFNSWAEVNNWARLLFPANVTLPAALKDKIKEISTACKTSEEKAAAALRFVQDDIRYMGIEIGIHSHKPASPGKVFNQRFGDCKEKSYLLCVMLNAMGINASPVLINTDDKKAITQWLPAPVDFDHCTVQTVINNKVYWLDPTISYQRGGLSAISYPDYQYGLVITDTTTALSAIQPQGLSYENVKEIFTVPDHGTCYFKVITNYSGSYADDQRDDFNSNSNYEMQKKYLTFYQGYFNDIKGDSLTYDDNDSTGIFTTTEYYSIDSFWTWKNNTRTVDFTCYVMSSLLKKPKEIPRTMPLGLSFPVHCSEELDINLPDGDWGLVEVNHHIHCPSFAFTKNSTVYPNRIVIDYDYQRLKDNVMPAEASEYLSSLQEINDKQDYEITWGNGDNTTAPSSTAWNILGVIVVIIILIVVMVWWTQKP